MSELLDKIHDYLKSKGQSDENLKFYDSTSVYLSMEIMEYAHRNQKRENGEDYAEHPSRCLQIYQDIMGIKPHDMFCIDEKLMRQLAIPYDGVQEVCLLHDVIEDSDLSFEDVASIFKECGGENHFNTYIADALKRITHDKTMPYNDYIEICAQNPISALAKMIDMEDNSNVFSLNQLDEKCYKRTRHYLGYIYYLNSIYHFIENIAIYRDLFQKDKEEK